MSELSLFAEVLLPLPLKDLYTYRVPVELLDSVMVGQRVVVQFGKQKIYSALVHNLHHNPPSDYTPKDIISLLDTTPIVNEIQFRFWKWIGDYYMCTRGEVMNAALPSALKLASETKIVLKTGESEKDKTSVTNVCQQATNENKDLSSLTDKEYLIAEALEIHKVLNLNEVSKIVQQKNVMPLIKSLIEKGIVLVEEEFQNTYKPKYVKYLRLTEEYQSEDKLKELFDLLEKKAYKQLEYLMLFLHQSRRFSDKPVEVRRSDLADNPKASDAALNALVKKGIIEIYKKQISRIEDFENRDVAFNVPTLSEDQIKAYDEIKKAYKEVDVVLFNGITSSGKTEIYVKLIKDEISKGQQVLYLVPEIALTTQLIARLKKYFGNIVGVYHSKFTIDERSEIWSEIAKTSQVLKTCEVSDSEVSESDISSRMKIIIGPRSAMFLPFSKLGLIIVDEEHDYSFKQYDSAPRYNARDSAIYLARLHNAKTLLGSATPSFESYHNAETGKYKMVGLDKRFGNISLPETVIVNIRELSKSKNMKSHFSPVLLDNIRYALEKKEQVILFQNRRGFSLRLECERCSWSPKCKNCDVTLIYHKQINQLRCHYCGYAVDIPDLCPACGSNDIKMKGFGTEKIEDELPLFFPEARIKRMDLDTTRSKYSYQQIIHDFEERYIDILVGTQMVTKGLDFDNVSLVGIMNADNMLHFPDFRTNERCYQQFAQVSGRAGRKNKQGRVIIQAYDAGHKVLRYVVKNDYTGLYKTELAERLTYNYPPFFRLIKITLKHKNKQALDEASEYLAKALLKIFKNRLLGPEYPLISRIKNLYIKDILLKIEKDSNAAAYKTALADKLTYFRMTYKSVRVIIDVDPG